MKLIEKKIPEAFLPGEFIREELEAREWGQIDLAAILGRSPNIISDIISGKRSISPDIAQELASAFGTSAELWLNLQTAHDLAMAERSNHAVARRAVIYDRVPIREMLKRGWIGESSNVDVLESRVCQFLEISDLRSEASFAHAARKSDDYGKITTAQLAWLMRAKKLAQALKAEAKYLDDRFDLMMTELASLLSEPESIRTIPRILSKYGLRFIVVEHLPKTKVDGACFGLDEHSPVVVLSLRYDRIDWFWHTLCHELKHVRERDWERAPLVETKVMGEDAQPTDEKPDEEKKADKFASEFLVDQPRLDDFVARHHPFYSQKSIIAFSKLIPVHPGIVIGQLQFKGVMRYSNLRGLLVRVRDIITSTAITDGWGRTIVI